MRDGVRTPWWCTIPSLCDFRPVWILSFAELISGGFLVRCFYNRYPSTIEGCSVILIVPEIHDRS